MTFTGQNPGAMYTSPTMSGGSTPVPGASGPASAYAPIGPNGNLAGFGGTGGLGSLGSLGGDNNFSPFLYICNNLVLYLQQWVVRARLLKDETLSQTMENTQLMVVECPNFTTRLECRQPEAEWVLVPYHHHLGHSAAWSDRLIAIIA